MSVNIPLTAVTTLTGAVIMGYAWLYLGRKVHDPQKPVWQSVRYMHKFFLHMMIFFIIMSVPYLWTNNPMRFSVSAAWAYVVGHVFMYLSLMYVSRMTFSLIPRLSPYDKPLKAAWLTVIALQTAFNAKTMIWGVQPTYNYRLHLTEFHTYTGVGIALGLMAAIAFVPTIILFAMHAIRARGVERVKPALLSVGFFLITTAGPLHDNARSAQQYAMADIFTTLGMVVVLSGIAFRMYSSLAAEAPSPQPKHVPSSAA